MTFTGMTKPWKLALVWFVLFGIHLAKAQRNAWVATWAASPEPADSDSHSPLLKIEDQTVRERLRVSIGGAKICLRFSNEYGSEPLVVGSATVAEPIDSTSVKPGSIRVVTFGGRNSATIPAGAPVLSDPVAFSVSPGAEISISVYFPKRVARPTLHALALKRAVVSPRGDLTRTEKIQGGVVSQSSILISAVLVPAQGSERLVVAFGDSVTDGDGSTVDADHNWPSNLVRRLGKTPEGSKLAVVNEGIVGNRQLSDGPLASFGASALARFDRDALSLPGVTHIVLLEGINDISFPGAKLGVRYLAAPADVRSFEDLVDGYWQLVSRAHTHGVKVIGATITPCEGADIPGYYSESKEAARQTVNTWIRNSGAFDGVIDFDAVVRDPDHPSRLLPRFASPDHLHPNDLGYQAMADAINPDIFK